MTKSKGVKVRITTECKFFYDQEIEISQEDWEEWHQLTVVEDHADYRAVMRKAAEIADNYVDFQNPADYDNIDGTDVEIEAVKD